MVQQNKAGLPVRMMMFEQPVAPVVLVVTFERHYASRVFSGVRIPSGRTFELIVQKQRIKRKQLLRTPSSVGKRDSMRVDEGRKGLKSCRDKRDGTYRSGEGEKSLRKSDCC